jgi:anti-anti-sigma factor
VSGDRIDTLPPEHATRWPADIPPWPAGHPSSSPAEDFRLRVKRRTTTCLLQLAGEFDICSTGRVQAALDGALRAVTRRVVFDLREVTFLDMAGLMTIIRANERSRTELFDLQVVPPAGLARRVFTLTRVGNELTMLDAVAGESL